MNFALDTVNSDSNTAIATNANNFRVFQAMTSPPRVDRIAWHYYRMTRWFLSMTSWTKDLTPRSKGSNIDAAP
jgi:hypothetical protein